MYSMRQEARQNLGGIMNAQRACASGTADLRLLHKPVWNRIASDFSNIAGATGSVTTTDAPEVLRYYAVLNLISLVGFQSSAMGNLVMATVTSKGS